eukprot:COSAG01_NODE_34704_length_543_cov_1.085586_1_plen_121_part_10
MHARERLTAATAAAVAVLPSPRRGGGGGRAAAAAAVTLGSPPLVSAPQRQGTAIIHRHACIVQARRLIDVPCPLFASHGASIIIIDSLSPMAPARTTPCTQQQLQQLQLLVVVNNHPHHHH